MTKKEDFYRKESGARKLAKEKKALFEARAPPSRGRAGSHWGITLFSFWGWRGSMLQIIGADQRIPDWPGET